MRLLAAALLCLSSATLADSGEWRELAPGLALGSFAAATPSIVGDSRLTVLRIDPAHWALGVYGPPSAAAPANRTAAQWCADEQLTAAINAGMFGADHLTHVGYLRMTDRELNARVNDYRSLAVFDPRRPGLPGFRIVDLEAPAADVAATARDYASAVQNLRLVAHPGRNRWSAQDKRWSEAALAQDGAGRALFVFARSPYTMRDFNRELLRLGAVAAQHLEGGPEAQLHLRLRDVVFDGFGSYETGFNENDDNARAWPVPYVLGIRPRH